MITNSKSSPNLHDSDTVNSSTAKTVDLTLIAPPYTITLIPGASNTSRCELSTTLGAAATPASANWIAWNNGDVSTITQDVLYGRLTALRFTRVSGTNADTYEVMA